MQKKNLSNREGANGDLMTAANASRPFGVAAIVGLQLIAAILTLVIIFWGDNVPSGGDSLTAIVSRFPRLGDLPLIANYAANLFGFIIAPGLWRLRRWAWVLTMFQLGINLGTSLVNYWTGDAQYLQMLLNVITVFYLNQRDVQHAFSHYLDLPILQVGELEG